MIPVRKNKVATNLKVHILQWVCPYHCMWLFHCVSNTKYTHYPTQFDRITCTISFYVTYFLWSLPVFFVLFDHTIACRQVQKLGIKDKRGKNLCFCWFLRQELYFNSASEVILRQTASTATWAHKSEKRGLVYLTDVCSIMLERMFCHGKGSDLSSSIKEGTADVHKPKRSYSVLCVV